MNGRERERERERIDRKRMYRESEKMTWRRERDIR
jgi:hypothetical protein